MKTLVLIGWLMATAAWSQTADTTRKPAAAVSRSPQLWDGANFLDSGLYFLRVSGKKGT